MFELILDDRSDKKKSLKIIEKNLMKNGILIAGNNRKILGRLFHE